jgi:hypothetical protein
MSLRPVVAAAVAVGALAMASSASAAAPTGAYAPFKYCPYQNTNVFTCIYSKNTSGTFKLGNATVPIPAGTTQVFQGGLGYSTQWDFYNASNGGQTLPPTPLKVPGGLLGLVNTGGWSGVLIDLFNAAVASVNDVYATAEQAGPVQFNYTNFTTGFNGTAVTLPIKVHLTNPFLGSNCYIGSNSNPITLHLTTGTTSPPAGVTPLTGSSGTLQPSDPTNSVTESRGTKLVDNTFPVPAASGCGYLLLDRILITAAVNAKEGLPSPAGNNYVILQGNSFIAASSDVAASVQ